MDHELAEQAVYHVWDSRTVFFVIFKAFITSELAILKVG